MSRTNSQKLLDAVTATGVSESKQLRNGLIAETFHAYGTTSTGTGSATIVIEVSNDASPVAAAAAAGWITAGTITLTLGTTRTDDGFSMSAKWRNVRARLSALSGTDATVTVQMGS